MIVLYLLVLLSLGIYSYSQIDLNLTLLREPWFLTFQHQMVQLGYFNRPLSTAIFLIITFFCFLLYILFFRKADKIPVRFLLAGTCLLGLLSYPAFSHDIFNYIFDARVLVFHHANPYTSTALMFPFDDWTRFMNWTHRTYPYGPTFLPITLVVYLLGFGKFIPTLLLFKALMVAAYLGSARIIYKLAKSKGLIFFALNPLVLFEVVVSGHLDIIMLFFALLGYYFYTKKKKVLGIFSWIMSIGIKYVTFIQFPGLPLSWLVLLAYIGAILQFGSRELLPHYFIVPLGFSALLPENKYVVWTGIALSMILLVLRYIPFISSGVWVPLRFIGV